MAVFLEEQKNPVSPPPPQLFCTAMEPFGQDQRSLSLPLARRSRSAYGGRAHTCAVPMGLLGHSVPDRICELNVTSKEGVGGGCSGSPTGTHPSRCLCRSAPRATAEDDEYKKSRDNKMQRSDRKLDVCKGVPEGQEREKRPLSASGMEASGRMMFYRHLERVETMRCYWEQREQQFKAKKDDETFLLKNLKSQKKKKTPDDADTAQALLSEEVQKLNEENFQCFYDDRNDAETSPCNIQLQERKEAVDLVSDKDKENRETDAQLGKQRSEEVQNFNQESFQYSYDDRSDAAGSYGDLQLQEKKEAVDLVSAEDKEKTETDAQLGKQHSEEVQKFNQENFQCSYDDLSDADGSYSDLQLQEKEAVELVSAKDKENRETDAQLGKPRSEEEQNLNQESFQYSHGKHSDAESSVGDMQLQERKEAVDLVSEKDKEKTDTQLYKQHSEEVQNLNQESFQYSNDDRSDAAGSYGDLQLQEKKEAVDLVSEKDKEKTETDAQLGKQHSEEVQKFNQENFQGSYDSRSDAESSVCDLQLQERKETVDLVSEKDNEKTDAQLEKPIEKHEELEEAVQKQEAVKGEEIKNEEKNHVDQPQASLPCSSQSGEAVLSSKRHLSQEDLQREEQKKICVEDRREEKEEGEKERREEEQQQAAEVRTEVMTEEGKSTVASAGLPAAGAGLHTPALDGEASTGEYIIDSSPPPPAPFEHRIVTTKTQPINSFYAISMDEILGGGRYGQVHKCLEKASGMTLAAKIIKARSPKEKDVVRNEIQVMNQLDHANLIQLYAAFETRYGITLVLEYVEGGELFDRIIDDSCNLTELDTVLFIRQISEGLQYMHRMYILHLDLKPENILCVSRETNKIKIIDFGLARKYKPREKLKVNFGTPEFLAPEVINYDFVSFPTDMWSLGVITYMLLSGLSPFLGDDDNETLNNILACQWSFDEVAEFEQTSDEAKDFITRLLVKSKCWRMSASQSLKHPWLSDRGLHYRLYERQKQLDLSKDTPPPPPPPES
ncbi:myosin light chain kinase 3-like [Sardina pilchardus]|uniref:myosin light chain kinase 3-like n=1 Tax=Sardina pilchardus TaxID=27697 RepID=UPI002E150BC7